MPNLDEREEILRIHTRNLSLIENINFRQLAEETKGMNGAELTSLCHKSSFIALTKAMKTGARVKINQAIVNQAIVELNRQRELREVSAGQKPWTKQNNV